MGLGWGWGPRGRGEQVWQILKVVWFLRINCLLGSQINWKYISKIILIEAVGEAIEWEKKYGDF